MKSPVPAVSNTEMSTPLPTHARAVVVGAGIAGCSIAWHLTRLGWREVVVLDQGPLFETGGSTSHAPGLVFQVNPSKTMTAFARRTVDLFTRLELDGKPCARSVGSLEVAWTPERLTDLKRRHGYATSWGLEAHLLGPGEARERIPTLSERILGALYVPSDIQTRATRPAEAMAREAQQKGASFHGGVKVTGFGIAGGQVTAVHTTQGEIRTDVVVAAAGIWAPKLGGMAGVPIPLSPMQHLYAVTTPLPELAGAAAEPILRHQDEAMYFRQVGECYGIGSYQHEPLLVDAGDIPAHEEASTPPAEMPFTPQHFEKALAAAGEVMPCLKGVGLARRFNGLFSFTTDGFPVLGESPQVRGFWSAQAVWITHAGGVGQAVAEWLVHGEPAVDLRECDIRRFHPHASHAPLRALPGGAAVPRGLRHHPPAPADRQPPGPAGDALPPPAAGVWGPCSSRTRAGSAPSGTNRTRACSIPLRSRVTGARGGRRWSGRRSWPPSMRRLGNGWPSSI